MSSLTPFRFDAHAVRVIEIDAAPWFVAKDVMLALDYSESSASSIPQKIAHVPEEWRGRHPMSTPYGTQELLCLSEQGLYFFLGRSDKPKALPFQKWLAGEVLPAIRKTGVYRSPLSPHPSPTAGRGELDTLRAQLTACQAFITQRHPLFGKLQRYRKAGLTQREIAVLCGWVKRETVRRHVRQAESLGLLPTAAPQMALTLEG